MPTRRCLEPGCVQLTTATRCIEHAKRRAAPARAVYDDGRWRRLRARVIRDALGWCSGWECAPHLAPRELTADHRIPISLGGAPFDVRNVVALCRACNGRKRDA